MKPCAYPEDACPRLLDEGQPCGDEGQMCEACFKAKATYWASYFKAIPHFDCESCGALTEGRGPMCPKCWEEDDADARAERRSISRGDL